MGILLPIYLHIFPGNSFREEFVKLLFIAAGNNLGVLRHGIFIFHEDIKNTVIRKSKKKICRCLH